MFNKTAITIFLLFIILLLGLFLRKHNYTSVPRQGATFDEFAWVWLGINLIQKGVPISWSPHPQYTYRKEIRYQGAAFLIVKPYLEHPPLFGLVAGSFALFNGASDMYHVTLTKIRPLALILGTLSIFVLFLFVQELYGTTIALFTSLLYATVPTVVIGSRIVQNENFLIPFWLLSLYLLVKYLKTENPWFRNVAALIAGLLTLAKVPWLVVGLSLSMILSSIGKWKDALVVGVVTILIFSLFFLYGMYFDKDLFVSLWRLQLARYDISFAGIYSIFTNPLLVDRYFLDGWIYFGYFSLFLLLHQYKKHIFIILPFFAYLLIFLFAIPDEPGHGWYRYPFYPFLISAIALFLKKYFSKNPFLTFLFLAFVGITLFQLSWVVAFGFSYVVYRLTLLTFAATLLPLFTRNKRIAKVTTILAYGWFIIFIFFNIWSIMIYNGQ